MAQNNIQRSHVIIMIVAYLLSSAGNGMSGPSSPVTFDSVSFNESSGRGFLCSQAQLAARIGERKIRGEYRKLKESFLVKDRGRVRYKIPGVPSNRFNLGVQYVGKTVWLAPIHKEPAGWDLKVYKAKDRTDASLIAKVNSTTREVSMKEITISNCDTGIFIFKGFKYNLIGYAGTITLIPQQDFDWNGTIRVLCNGDEIAKFDAQTGNVTHRKKRIMSRTNDGFTKDGIFYPLKGYKGKTIELVTREAYNWLGLVDVYDSGVKVATFNASTEVETPNVQTSGFRVTDTRFIDSEGRRITVDKKYNGTTMRYGEPIGSNGNMYSVYCSDSGHIGYVLLSGNKGKFIACSLSRSIDRGRVYLNGKRHPLSGYVRGTLDLELDRMLLQNNRIVYSLSIDGVVVGSFDVQKNEITITRKAPPRNVANTRHSRIHPDHKPHILKLNGIVVQPDGTFWFNDTEYRLEGFKKYQDKKRTREKFKIDIRFPTDPLFGPAFLVLHNGQVIASFDNETGEIRMRQSPYPYNREEKILSAA